MVRARLIDAAERCFERQAYAEVGVLDIVREAGMSSRSFYQHFQSKVDLAVALTEARAEVYLQSLEGMAAEATTILEGVDRSLTAFLEDLPLVVIEMRNASGPDADRVRAAVEGYRMRMGAAFLREFDRALKQGVVDEVPDPLGVLIVIYGIESLVTQTPRGPDRRAAMIALKPQILAAVRKLFPKWLENPRKLR
ncbi:MAG: TetR/AcrR family transcriptional regulator [Myxococcota bacterium]